LGEGILGGPEAWAGLRRFLEGLPATLPSPPRAALVVTAHWEAPVPTVSSASHPPMVYDYSGFPPETYRVSWPAPGEPALAARVRGLLAGAGLASADDPARGFDHGTFVPMAVAWPRADLPTVQLSLVRGLDPDLHLRIGRAIAPLRDEGALIVCSGMSYHDMRGFFTSSGAAASEVFDAWLRETVALPGPQRDARLRSWSTAPAARACHPREEHLLPLMVASGAAGDAPGSTPYSERLLGVRVSAARWG
jgi:aromatic ring-opening dioxygenase catalytic subunit (LigB family)